MKKRPNILVSAALIIVLQLTTGEILSAQEQESQTPSSGHVESTGQAESTGQGDSSNQVADPYQYKPEPPFSPFSQGRVRLSLALGWGYAFGNNYFLTGLGAGFYVLDGLEIGADTEFWIGPSPFVFGISPGLRYVFHMVPVVKPYIGGFYRHMFVTDNVPDVDSLGMRLGAFLTLAGRFYLGLGVVPEWYLNCDSNAHGDCFRVYPELSFMFAL